VNEELPPDPNPSPQQSGKLKFLLLALGPIPIGLLIFTSNIFLKANPGQNGLMSELVMMGIFTFFCSLIGSIGLCGGFDGGDRPKAWIGGIALGIILFIVEVFLIFFVGCAIIASHN
jgi:hypothetical protein